jgi:5-methylcytosine-specific restriction enzyme subunit McrC
VSHLAREAGTRKKAFLLKPDLLARRNQEPWIVADTKWKLLDAYSPNLGISEADVYQVMAYAHHYHATQAVLIYPHHPALGAPGHQREFLTAGPQPVQIQIVTLDLAQPELVPEQLQRGFSVTHA